MSTAKRLQDLLQVTQAGCQLLSSMVRTFYSVVNNPSAGVAKEKSDASIFTIADGIVQHMLSDHLFAGGSKFAAIVGEEDAQVNISTRPYTVEGLNVPTEFADMIDAIRTGMANLSKQIDGNAYKDLTVFIDPIDGTREFSTALGEQCSICIGFADRQGKPVAGIVFRPIPAIPTWAAGAGSENYVAGELDIPAVPNPKGFLTSNGSVSKFLVSLMGKMGFERVPSGGAGNKMLMLLEGKGGCYIQDRGVSRWDTCAAQAVIEAYGGRLCKLNTFVENKSLEGYTYLTSEKNLDFVSGLANLTAYNVANKQLEDQVKASKGTPIPAVDVAQVKAYANLCGLLALDKTCLQNIDIIHAAIIQAAKESPLAYD